MLYVYNRKISSWEEFFMSNWIWDLGDIILGKCFAVRFLDAWKREKKMVPPLLTGVADFGNKKFVVHYKKRTTNSSVCRA
jgi:hypothetical protein